MTGKFRTKGSGVWRKELCVGLTERLKYCTWDRGAADRILNQAITSPYLQSQGGTWWFRCLDVWNSHLYKGKG